MKYAEKTNEICINNRLRKIVRRAVHCLKCHTSCLVKCGISLNEVWHLPCSSVAFGNNKPRIITGMTTLG